LALDRRQQVWSPLKRELERDYLSLEEIIRRTRRVHPSLNAAETHLLVMEVIGHAVRSGEAQACQYDRSQDRYIVWEQPADEILTRIDREWRELGVEVPRAGEVVWLCRPKN
jgi:hypothetical protein